VPPPPINITLIPAGGDQWATWVGDGIALLALIAAGIAAWATLRQLKTLRDENKRRQAAGVTAWIDGTREPLVLNSSASPVYNAVVLTDDPKTVYWFPVLAPMTQPIRAEKSDAVVSMSPRPGRPTATRQPDASQSRPKPRPIAYMDAAGFYWRREESGDLIECRRHPWHPFDDQPPETETTQPETVTGRFQRLWPWRPQRAKPSEGTPADSPPGTEATCTESTNAQPDPETE
jgi:hypothetical protein